MDTTFLCKNTLFQNPQKWYMTQFWRTDASIWAWMIAIAMLSFIANCSANLKSQDMILQLKHVAAWNKNVKNSLS